MELNSRKKEILNMLYVKGRITVGELSKTLFVSEMTIRRDLSEMEKGGYLRRYRGGAILKVDNKEMPITERVYLDEDEKKELCQQCVPFLRDGITIYLDSSSTCLYLIAHIQKYRGVMIVTNSVQVVLSASVYHIPCLLIGGEYYEQDMCLVGSIAEQYAKELNIDVAFFSTAAYSDDGVISDFDLRQTMIRKIILKNVKESIFLFEGSKIGKKMTYTLCRREDVTRIILGNPI
jgi:DeoR family glycerol-3-phosphate regulon repressor